MPHITVEMYPGRTAEQKEALAHALAETASKALGREIEHFSVSVVDVPQNEWKESVYKKATDPHNEQVIIRPGYTM